MTKSIVRGAATVCWRGRERGATLLETAVVLVVTGILAGALLWVLSPTPSTTSETDATSAENAIVGYALAHQALPPNGWLDPTTVGLPAGAPIWYAGDTRLDATTVAYTPDPYQHNSFTAAADGSVATWQALRASITGASNNSSIGLVDFCATLLQAQQSPQLTAGGIPVAFVIQMSKTVNVLPPDPRILPGSPQAQQLAAHGTLLQGVGFGELISRLHCPSKLAAAGSAAKAVVVAQDLTTVAQAQQQFRDLKYHRAQYSQLSDDFQIGIRSGLLADLTADFASTNLQLRLVLKSMSAPDKVIQPWTIATVANIVAADVVILEYGAAMIQIVSSVNPPTDLSVSDETAVQRAANDLTAAGAYVQQLHQLQQGRQNQYLAVIQGS
ncbi:type II secretion system protein [Burkholderia cepacia]|uniref:type II secretion system protein n=1 Tax=Burkholderia cepacia TaxID=292 RepID=UPI00158E568E|nr:type II secretion system protein [Burkholderia cepacia]